MPEVGQTIAGKYRIDRAIGAGGMGAVYAATHLQLDTQLALKFLSEKIKDSASSVQRFSREARACAQLRSEHVCRVTDFGVEDGTPYIAMELLDGIDLARLIDSGRTELGVAVDFVLQACTGLAEAHGHGIVHRDLKPGNLFLTRRPDGSLLIKVLDFGIAKIPMGDDDASLTKTSHVVGSPGYMAPEQLRSSKTVDRRADVWALGVILYELISTRHPFYAEATTEVALKIAMDEPPLLAEAPEPLRAVVMKCLAKEPDARFATVTELATALAPFAQHDRAAAAAAMSGVIEAAIRRRSAKSLTTKVSRGDDEATAATKVETPRAIRQESTHEAGAGAYVGKPAPASKRAAWVIGSVLVAGIAGGAIVVAANRGGGEPIAIAPVEFEGALPDAAVAITTLDAPPTQDGLVAVEILIKNGDATILVDDVIWAIGRRAMSNVPRGIHVVVLRAPNRIDERHEITVDDAMQITLDMPRPKRAPPKPAEVVVDTSNPIKPSGTEGPSAKPAGSATSGGSATKPAGSTTPVERSPGTEGSAATKVDAPAGSAAPPAGSASGGSATPSAGSATPPAGSATPPAGSAASPRPGFGDRGSITLSSVSRADAEAMVAKIASTLTQRGLSQDDLGVTGMAIQNKLSRARSSQDWPAVHAAASQMVAAAETLKIDRAFVSGKSARLIARLRQSSASDALRAQIEQMQQEAKALIDAADFATANRKLNQAFALVPPRTRGRSPAQVPSDADDLVTPGTISK